MNRSKNLNLFNVFWIIQYYSLNSAVIKSSLRLSAAVWKEAEVPVHAAVDGSLIQNLGILNIRG